MRKKRKAGRDTDVPKRDLSLFCFWSRAERTAEKDGNGGKDAAGSSGKKEADGQRREVPQRWRQPRGEDRTEMKIDANLLGCALVNGSTWSTKRKYMRRYKGKCDIFFGIKHRLRKEEMEEPFNREAKEGWRFAADAAIITDERASSEDRKHTSVESLLQSMVTW